MATLSSDLRRINILFTKKNVCKWRWPSSSSYVMTSKWQNAELRSNFGGRASYPREGLTKMHSVRAELVSTPSACKRQLLHMWSGVVRGVCKENQLEPHHVIPCDHSDWACEMWVHVNVGYSLFCCQAVEHGLTCLPADMYIGRDWYWAQDNQTMTYDSCLICIVVIWCQTATGKGSLGWMDWNSCFIYLIPRGRKFNLIFKSKYDGDWMVKYLHIRAFVSEFKIIFNLQKFHAVYLI